MTALIIFTDNPEHATLEPALAAEIPPDKLLYAQESLSNRVRNLTALFAGEKYLYYSHFPNWNDKWDINEYRKRLQVGDSLTERIHQSIEDAADELPESIIWLDTAAYALRERDLTDAVAMLRNADLLIGETAGGRVLMLGFSQKAYSFALPDELNGDRIAIAAAGAGLRALRLPLPNVPQHIAELETLGITLE